MITSHKLWQKIQMIEFLWQTAYADNVLDVDEERLFEELLT